MRDIKNAANAFLSSQGGDKLKGKLGEVEKLAESADGKAVEAILQQNGDALTRALENGDTKAMQSALNDILNTQSGRNIIDQLSKLMK